MASVQNVGRTHFGKMISVMRERRAEIPEKLTQRAKELPKLISVTKLMYSHTRTVT